MKFFTIFTVGFILREVGAHHKSNLNDVTRNLVFSDNEVDSNKIPYHVSLELRFKNKNYTKPLPRCSGSIISENWVLTAAHCCKGANVILITYRNVDLESEQLLTVKTSYIKMHPEFDDISLANNICLIKTPLIKFSGGVQKIKLPPISFEYSDYQNAEGVVAGWDNKIQSQKPWYAKITVVGNSLCAKYYPTASSENFCAFNPDRVRACIGDSGSAFALRTDLGVIQIGIKSADIKRICKKKSLVIFTRVKDHLIWIKQVSDVEYFDMLEIN